MKKSLIVFFRHARGSCIHLVYDWSYLRLLYSCGWLLTLFVCSKLSLDRLYWYDRSNPSLFFLCIHSCNYSKCLKYCMFEIYMCMWYVYASHALIIQHSTHQFYFILYVHCIHVHQSLIHASSFNFLHWNHISIYINNILHQKSFWTFALKIFIIKWYS